MALGQALAVRTDHQWDVEEAGAGNAKQVVEQRLVNGAGEEVIAAHDFFNSLVGIIDDNRKVVGNGAVATAHDDVVSHGTVGPVPCVGYVNLGLFGAQPQRERLAGGDPAVRGRRG